MAGYAPLGTVGRRVCTTGYGREAGIPQGVLTMVGVPQGVLTTVLHSFGRMARSHRENGPLSHPFYSLGCLTFFHIPDIPDQKRLKTRLKTRHREEKGTRAHKPGYILYSQVLHPGGLPPWFKAGLSGFWWGLSPGISEKQGE